MPSGGARKGAGFCNSHGTNLLRQNPSLEEIESEIESFFEYYVSEEYADLYVDWDHSENFPERSEGPGYVCDMVSGMFDSVWSHPFDHATKRQQRLLDCYWERNMIDEYDELILPVPLGLGSINRPTRQKGTRKVRAHVEQLAGRDRHNSAHIHQPSKNMQTISQQVTNGMNGGSEAGVSGTLSPPQQITIATTSPTAAPNSARRIKPCLHRCKCRRSLRATLGSVAGFSNSASITYSPLPANPHLQPTAATLRRSRTPKSWRHVELCA